MPVQDIGVGEEVFPTNPVVAAGAAREIGLGEDVFGASAPALAAPHSQAEHDQAEARLRAGETGSPLADTGTRGDIALPSEPSRPPGLPATGEQGLREQPPIARPQPPAAKPPIYDVDQKTGQLIPRVPYGQVPVLDAGAGLPKIAKGATALTTRAPLPSHPIGTPPMTPAEIAQVVPTHYMDAASDILEGTGQLLTPVAAGMAVVAPVTTALMLAKTLVAQVGATKATAILGGSPSAQRLVGNVAGTAVALGVGGQQLHDMTVDTFLKGVDAAKTAARPLVLAGQLHGAGYGTGEVPGFGLGRVSEGSNAPIPSGATGDVGPAGGVAEAPLPGEPTRFVSEPSDLPPLETTRNVPRGTPPAAPAPTVPVGEDVFPVEDVATRNAAAKAEAAQEARGTPVLGGGTAVGEPVPVAPEGVLPPATADRLRELGYSADEIRALTPSTPAEAPTPASRIASLADGPTPDTKAVPFPVAPAAISDTLHRATDFSQAHLEDVPIDQLIATQDTVHVPTIEAKLAAPEARAETLPAHVGETEGDLPRVHELDGKFYLAGGTHRAVAAWARGESTIQAVVAPVNPDWIANPPARTFLGRLEQQQAPAAVGDAVFPSASPNDAPAPHAEFAQHDPSGPMYTVVGGPSNGSTVGVAALGTLGLPVPETPPDTGEGRAKALDARAAAEARQAARATTTPPPDTKVGDEVLPAGAETAPQKPETQPFAEGDRVLRNGKPATVLGLKDGKVRVKVDGEGFERHVAPSALTATPASQTSQTSAPMTAGEAEKLRARLAYLTREVENANEEWHRLLLGKATETTLAPVKQRHAEFSAQLRDVHAQLEAANALPDQSAAKPVTPQLPPAGGGTGYVLPSFVNGQRTAKPPPAPTGTPQEVFRKFKTALAKAVNAKDWPKVIAEADRFDAYYSRPGAEPWPDDHHRWQRAKEDAEYALLRAGQEGEIPGTKPLAPAKTTAQQKAEALAPQWKPVGSNEDGDPVYEDQRGARSWVNTATGFRTIEPQSGARPRKFLVPSATKPEPATVSYQVDIKAVGEGWGARNALRFATKAEAEGYASNLLDRWSGAEDSRVVESSDPVNYRWNAATGLSERVETAAPEEPLPSPGKAPTVEVGDAVFPESSGAAEPDHAGSDSGDVDASEPGSGPAPPDVGRPGPAAGGGARVRPDRPARGPRARPRPDVGDRTGDGRDRPAAPADDEPVDAPAAGVPGPVRVEGSQPANYHITDADHLGAGGTAAKFARNLRAIQLAKAITAADRPATAAEQAELVQFVGWGGLKRELSDARAQLLEDGTLTADEYHRAFQSVLNAHYTSPGIITAMWQTLQDLGFHRGRVLEPGMGIGHFFGLMPADVTATTQAGVELDTLTGRIAQLLYPQARIQVTGLQDAQLPNDYFDVAVSNVPFGRTNVADPASKIPTFVRATVHNYYFAKNLQKIRPGGLLLFITTHGTLDAGLSQPVRKYLGDRADFLGAVRLPDTAFKANAGTEVVTDIILMRRRLPGEAARHVQPDWITTTKQFASEENPGGIPISTYFVAHPEQVVGTMGAQGTMYGGGGQEISVTYDQDDVPAQAATRLRRLVTDALAAGVGYAPAATGPTTTAPAVLAPDAISEQMFYTDDAGVLRQRLNGEGEVVTGPARRKAVLKDYLGLRDAFRALVATQRAPESTDAEVAAARKPFEKAYDRFVKRQGPLHSAQNQPILLEDPYGPAVMAVETWKPETRTAGKAAIFRQRTVQADTRATHANSSAEALAISLSETGAIDWPRIAGLLSVDPDQAKALLVADGRVFETPAGPYEIAERYLSGRVRDKLAAARDAAKLEERFDPNVKALEQVQPADMPESRIVPHLGAPWIPVSVVNDFIARLGGRGLTAVYRAVTAEWAVEESKFSYSGSAGGEARNWETPRADLRRLLDDTLNNKATRITDKDGVDVAATLEATTTQERIRAEFQTWAWADRERAQTLARRYNDTLNGIALPTYDGSHLQLPGMIASWRDKLMPHQLAAIWRAILDGNTYLAHTMGAGKTVVIMAIAMEHKRMGKASKPVIVIPKQTLGDYARFAEVYPSARVLVGTKESTTGPARKQFMARIATGDWDAVIITRDAMVRMPAGDVAWREYVSEQLEALRAAASEEDLAAVKDKKKRGRLSDLARAIERLEQRYAELQKRIEARKDVGLNWEDLGADMLIVDEAHGYRKMTLATQLDQVAGVPTGGGSQRADDLYIKARMIAKATPGRNLVFASGTPIVNSVAELYILQKFLQPEALKLAGVDQFDAWAATFGRIVTKYEADITGTRMKAKRRFAEFSNMNGLIQMFRSVMDVKLKEDLNLETPPVTGGEATIVPIDAGPALKRFVKSLAVRVDNLDPRDRVSDNMLMISGDGRKAGLDLRLVGVGEGGHKLRAVAERILSTYKQWDKRRGTQLAFMELGVPGGAMLSMYDALKDLLVDGGMQADQIAFIQDAKTDPQRDALMAKMRAGEVRVLMGARETMGTGINVQDRLVHLHHVDPHWLPALIEQADGRGIRQGNKFFEAKSPERVEGFTLGITHYVTMGSFDAFMWQAVSWKGLMINQALRGNLALDRVEDIGGGAVFNAAEIAAIGTGNPIMMERMNLEQRLSVLQMLADAHGRTQRDRASDVAVLPGRIAAHKKAVKIYQEIQATVTPTAAVVISGTPYEDLSEADKAIRTFVWSPHLAALETFAFSDAVAAPGSRISLGDRYGDSRATFKVGTVAADPIQVSLKFDPKTGVYTGATLVLNHEGVEGFDSSGVQSAPVTRLIDTVQTGAKARQMYAEEDITREELTLEDAKKNAAKPFADAAELAEVQTRLEEIYRQMSAHDSDAAVPDEDEAEGETKPEDTELRKEVPPIAARTQATNPSDATARAQIRKAYAKVPLPVLRAEMDELGPETDSWPPHFPVSVLKLFGVHEIAPDDMTEDQVATTRHLEDLAVSVLHHVALAREGQQGLGFDEQTPAKGAKRKSPNTDRDYIFPVAQMAIIPGAHQFLERDVKPGLQAAFTEAGAAHASIRALWAPDTVSTPAEIMSAVMRPQLAIRRQRDARARKAMRALEVQFDKVALGTWKDQPTANTQMAFAMAVDEGRVDELPAWQQPVAQLLASISAKKRDESNSLGAKVGYIKDYFAREWLQPGKVRQVVMRALYGKRPLQGRGSFKKARARKESGEIYSFRELLKGGFEPVASNPITAHLRKWTEMDKWIAARRILLGGREHGVATYVKTGQKEPEGTVRYPDSFGVVYGPPVVSVKEAYDAGLMEAIHTFAQEHGIRMVRKVALGGRKWGYTIKAGAQGAAPSITTKFAGPEGVLMHEIGHVLDNEYGLGEKIGLAQASERHEEINFAETPSKVRRELRDLADLRAETTASKSFKTYIRKRAEVIANLVHAFLYVPDKARAVAPNAYWALYNLAKDTPALHGLLDIQKARSLRFAVAQAEIPVGGLVIAGRYYGPPDAVRLLENHLSPGLRGHVVFDLYRQSGNFLNQVQLGLSAFHVMTTSANATISKGALALEQLARGQVWAAAKSAALAHSLVLPPILGVIQGDRLLKQFYARDANFRELVHTADIVVRGGGGVGWDTFWHNSAPERFLQALRGIGAEASAGNYPGAALRTGSAAIRMIPAAVEALAKPVMNWWVPRLKLAAFMDLARMELADLGPHPDPLEAAKVLGKAWDAIDNRFGELIYDNVFWNGILKDAGMASVRALGWNLGTVREVFGAIPAQAAQLGIIPGAGSGGGFGKPPIRLRNTGTDAAGTPIYEAGRAPWLTHPFAYLMALVYLSAVFGALYQKLHTGLNPGEQPDGSTDPTTLLLDLYFPRTGGVKPDGHPERASLWTYMKDVFAFLRHPITTAANKANPILTLLIDLIRNEDFYGNALRNEDDPLVQQLADSLKYVASQYVPISVRTFQQRQAARGTTGLGAAESVLGINVAPQSVTRTPLEDYLHQVAPPTHRTQEEAAKAEQRRALRAAIQDKDAAAATAAIKAGALSRRSVLATAKNARLQAIQLAFRSTTLDQAVHAYTLGTPEERRVLKPDLARKLQTQLPGISPDRVAGARTRFLTAWSLPTAAAPVAAGAR